VKRKNTELSKKHCLLSFKHCLLSQAPVSSFPLSTIVNLPPMLPAFLSESENSYLNHLTHWQKEEEELSKNRQRWQPTDISTNVLF